VTDVTDKEWPFEAYYAAFSYACRVRSDLPQWGDLLDRLLAPFRMEDANGVPTFTMTRAGGNEARYLLTLEGRQIQKPKSAGSMIDLIISQLTIGAVERMEDHIVIHAGSVAWSDAGILLPAPPDSGKSTLTVGLTCAGFSFFTDEAAPINLRSGYLHPFPRPAAMDPDAIDIIPGLSDRLPPGYHERMRYRVHVTPEDMRGEVGRPCPIRLVIAPTYRGGEPTKLIPMTKAEAAMTLAKNSFNLERVGGRALDTVKDVVEGAECYRLLIGDLDGAIDTIRNVVGAR
jgi:hypothetical protein